MDEFIYRVIGTDDLEGTIFAYCSTYDKAKKAKELLEAEGFDGVVDIVQDEFIIDHIWIGEDNIEL